MNTDSLAFRERIRFALAGAARHAPHPAHEARKWMHWLDEEAMCPDGTKGWRGVRVTWTPTAEQAARLRARIDELHEDGKSAEEIAAAVNRSRSRVEHILSELGLTGERR